jgi:hypothetical protein
MTIAVVVFAVAAVFGTYLAVSHFAGRPLPLPAALLHGAFAAAGIALLLLACLKTGFAGLPALALGLFVAAALGGFLLFAMHLRGKRLPSPVVVVHALAAVAAFALLAYAAFARLA